MRPTDRDKGVEQLESYMSACLNARFGMWIGSELQVWEKVPSGTGGYTFVEATDIPRFGFDAPKPLTFADLAPAHEELIAAFKRCHNYIYGNQGLQKESAFQELLKLIFCKVYDEDESVEQVRFFIGNEERRSDLGQRRLSARIDQLFEQVKAHYSYIFDPNERLRLDKRVLAYVVGELQRFSLLQTQADVKGAAYEQLVGANLRGDRGEFFTPRNVCDMVVRMVFTTYPRQEWTRLRVLDPACGTGGFLVAVMGLWREQLYEQQLRKWAKDEDRAIRETKRRVKDVADANLLGIDFNPVLARAAQMNLVVHGDGSTNVFHANSLLPPGEWPTDVPSDVAHHIRPGTFDIILTNPPFGAKIPIDDPHILEQFQLATFEMQKGQVRASMPPEQLFIERCLVARRGTVGDCSPGQHLVQPGFGVHPALDSAKSSRNRKCGSAASYFRALRRHAD